MIEKYNNYEIKYESTFRIGGTVSEVFFPSTIDELVQILTDIEPDEVLGGCSNVLFSSSHIDKKIVITKNINEYSFDGTKLTVECGVKGPFISKECQNRGLSGFEFLIGFPGTFGGMVYMNASAHNQAISDNFIEASVFNKKTKKIETFNKEQMNFQYRKTRISDSDYIVLKAEFELKEGNIEHINEIMQRNIEFRKNRQPSLTYGNAGSIFKNPDNDSAGRLLDLCELKGEKQGGAIVFDKHANFILNADNATSIDVLLLMQKMYSRVKEKYTIELQPEIKYIGNNKTEEYGLWEKISSGNIRIAQE